MNKYNFTIQQGIKFGKSVYWKDNTNTPYDLTGWTGEMQLRKDFDSDIITTLSTANGKIVITSSIGKIDIILTDLETSALDEDDFPCVYDLELTDSSGDVVKRLLEGEIKLSREATK